MSTPRTQIDPLNPVAPLGAVNPLNRASLPPRDLNAPTAAAITSGNSLNNASLPPRDLKSAAQQAPTPSENPLNNASLPPRDFLRDLNPGTKIEYVLVTPDLVGHLANLSHPSLLSRLEATNKKLRNTNDPALVKDYDYGLMTMDFNFRNPKITPLAMPVVDENGKLTVPADTKRRIEKESIAKTFNSSAVKNA